MNIVLPMKTARKQIPQGFVVVLDKTISENSSKSSDEVFCAKICHDPILIHNAALLAAERRWSMWRQLARNMRLLM